MERAPFSLKSYTPRPLQIVTPSKLADQRFLALIKARIKTAKTKRGKSYQAELCWSFACHARFVCQVVSAKECS